MFHNGQKCSVHCVVMLSVKSPVWIRVDIGPGKMMNRAVSRSTRAERSKTKFARDDEEPPKSAGLQSGPDKLNNRPVGNSSLLSDLGSLAVISPVCRSELNLTDFNLPDKDIKILQLLARK